MEAKTFLPCVVNNMAAEFQVTQEAKTSAAMVLPMLARKIPVSEREMLTLWMYLYGNRIWPRFKIQAYLINNVQIFIITLHNEHVNFMFQYDNMYRNLETIIKASKPLSW